MVSVTFRYCTPLVFALLIAGAASAQSQQEAAPPSPPAAAAPVATAAPAAAAPAAEYRIGSGDKLQIQVYKDPQLSPTLQVRPDGRITLPLIGDIAATGRTAMDLQQDLAARLKEFVANPVVTVMVLEVAERVVYVLGEVNQPGAVPLRAQMTVLQALAVAGGFKEFANPKGIVILRRNGSPERTEKVAFNYKDAVKAESPVVYLLEGDTVVVP